MLNDIRQMKEKIEKAKKEKAMMEEKLKEKQKKEVYGSVHQQIKDMKRKTIENHKSRIRLGNTVLFLKLSGVAGLFIFLSFALHSAFTNGGSNANIKIMMEESVANELDSAMALKYVREMLDDVSSNGVEALENHWSPSADEESRFYGREILTGISAASIDFKSVKSLPHNSLKVNCTHNGHPISFSIGGAPKNMSLMAVN